MDNVLSKLRSTVTTTITSTINNTVSNINQLSNFLPGNPVTREFEISTSNWKSGGNTLCWKIYDAIKKSTNQEASIFVLEKKNLDKFNKKDREYILETIRKAVIQLTRLRHPAILKVEHSLEESRDLLAFAVEPVLCSLANVLGNTENMSIPISPEMEKYDFYDVEIRYGLLQIAEGLSFLHNDVKLLHRNICPENIIITKQGVWKLFGFEFCAQPVDVNDHPLYFPFMNIINQTNDYPNLLLPNLNFIAPEYYIKDEKSDNKKILLNSDLYSLGCLTYKLYNKKENLLQNASNISDLNQKRINELKNILNNFESYLHCIPEESRYHVKNLLYIDSFMRPNIIEFLKLSIFDNVPVKALQYLDSLFQWGNLEKSNFYKGLPEVLSLMPKRVKINKILPLLAKEFVNPEMIPFILPNYLLIVEEIDDEKFFIKTCLPQLNTIFQMKEPIQIPMILMHKIELLLIKCKKNNEIVKNYILPMICRCFDYDNTSIQELCLQTVPSVSYLIDQSLIKNSILPKIKKLCLTNHNLSIKVKCLLCLGKIIEFLDKWIVIDEIINFLPEINSKEAAVIMTIIGIYQLTFSHNKLGIPKEILCNKVLPNLFSLSIENNLNTSQYETIMNLIKLMIQKIEVEHKNKLQQLDAMRSQQNTSLISYNSNIEKNQLDFDFINPKPLNELNVEKFEQSTKQNSLLNNNSNPQSNSIFIPNLVKQDKTNTDYFLNQNFNFSINNNQKTTQKANTFLPNYNLDTNNFNNKSLNKNSLDTLPVFDLINEQKLNKTQQTEQVFTKPYNSSKEITQYNTLNKSDLDQFLN